jgi:hypothetical protein
MEPNRLGRVLGISARVAAKTIRERAAQSGQTAGGSGVAQQPAQDGVPAAAAARPVGAGRPAGAVGRATVADSGRRLARGAGRFGSALIGPFAHATGVLTLQITGVFFGLFALFFLSHTWETWHAGGWRDPHTKVYAGLALLFGWFTVSSFWRARRKQRGR